MGSAAFDDRIVTIRQRDLARLVLQKFDDLGLFIETKSLPKYCPLRHGNPLVFV